MEAPILILDALIWGWLSLTYGHAYAGYVLALIVLLGLIDAIVNRSRD